MNFSMIKFWVEEALLNVIKNCIEHSFEISFLEN